MLSPFQIYSQLTSAELDLIQNLSGLTYLTGDIIYINSSGDFINLGIGSEGKVLTVVSGIPAWTTNASGSVSSVSVVTANGVSGSVATPTTTPAVTLTLGAITPSSVAASGTVTGSNLSGTNTGNQNLFKTIVVAGQTTITAEQVAEALTLVAGANISITTDPENHSLTITGATPLATGVRWENPAQTPNGSITAFTFIHPIEWITLNGQTLVDDSEGFTRSADKKTITFDTAPATGDKVHGWYYDIIPTPVAGGSYRGPIPPLNQ